MARILVIDDNAELRTILMHVLQDGGHDVRMAADGEDALTVLACFDAEIVVTDIFMPRSDGLELVRWLRAARPGVRTVAMSGGGRSGMIEVLDYARLLGADRTLMKPFGLAQIEAAIGTLIATPPQRRAA